MPITEEQKAEIDAMSYEDMLRLVRFAPTGHPLCRNDTGTGDYLFARMRELREQPGGDVRHIAASKRIGWD